MVSFLTLTLIGLVTLQRDGLLPAIVSFLDKIYYLCLLNDSALYLAKVLRLYRGAANAVADISWIRNLLLELQFPTTSATIVYCDNINAFDLLNNLVQRQRMKHIEIDIHYVRDKVALGQTRVLHVPSSS